MKNFALKAYFKPTPKRFRILGDTLLSISLFASSYAILMENSKVFGVSTMVAGCIGKFLTNFFVEDSTQEKEQQ